MTNGKRQAPRDARQRAREIALGILNKEEVSYIPDPVERTDPQRIQYTFINGVSHMHDLIIRGGRVIDPSQKIDAELDLAVTETAELSLLIKIWATYRAKP